MQADKTESWGKELTFSSHREWDKTEGRTSGIIEGGVIPGFWGKTDVENEVKGRMKSTE